MGCGRGFKTSRRRPPPSGPRVASTGVQAGGGRGRRGEGRWKLRDEQTGKTSWRRIEIQAHWHPLTRQPPCSKCRRLPTPHLLPAAAECGAREVARPGSAPSPSERGPPRKPTREGGGRAGRGRRGDRPGEARTRPPCAEESPTCQALCSGPAGPTAPRAEASARQPRFPQSLQCYIINRHLQA